MPGRKLSASGSESVQSEYTGTFETLRDEGEHFVHVAQYERAIESFTKALDLKADDIQCLVTRSQCYLQLGNATRALDDAEAALLQSPNFIRAVYQKAQALYQLGDFETALVFFHRGNKIRPELDEFRLGIQKSQEAIVNSIGTPDAIKLKGGDNIDLTDFYKEQERNKKAQSKGGYRKPGIQRKEQEQRSKKTSPDTERTIQQLLGELYGDKVFLESLLKDDCVTGQHTATSTHVRSLIVDCLDYLDTRTDFWRQQKPLYARKRDRDLKLKGRIATKKDPTKYILKQLELIDEAQAEGRYEESMKRIQRVMKTVESWSDDDISNKMEVMANLHSLIGNAYLEMGDNSKSLHHHNKDLDMANLYNLPEAKSRALDNLGRAYARRGSYGRAVDVWSEKLPLEKTLQESTWLYHEIGRCYLEMTRYTEAHDFGEKSFQAAREANDLDWQLNAMVLMAQSEVKLGQHEIAVDSFGRALEIAQANGDRRAEEAIKCAIKETNKKIVESMENREDDEYEHVEKEDSGDDGTNGTKALASQSPTAVKEIQDEPEIPEDKKSDDKEFEAEKVVE